jgi:hypothetical protein
VAYNICDSYYFLERELIFFPGETFETKMEGEALE